MTHAEGPFLIKGSGRTLQEGTWSGRSKAVAMATLPPIECPTRTQRSRCSRSRSRLTSAAIVAYDMSAA